jgi:hypothetical protein
LSGGLEGKKGRRERERCRAVVLCMLHPTPSVSTDVFFFFSVFSVSKSIIADLFDQANAEPYTYM